MYSLRPLIHEQVNRLLKDGPRVAELVAAHGSPLNLVFPQLPVNNWRGFTEVFAANGLKGTVFYAHKANKSAAIVRSLAAAGCSIDVASVGELLSALGNGFQGSRILATGPKSDDFLTLCLQHDVLVSVDDVAELKSLDALHVSMGLERPVRVMIRVNRFDSTGAAFVAKDVRFGVGPDGIGACLELLKSRTGSFDFYGYGFHLATTSVGERAAALEAICIMTTEAMAYGLRPRAVSVGGGFSINYLESGEEWETYVNALKQSVLDPSLPQMSWNGTGLGYRAEGGTLKGAARFFDFHTASSPFSELESCLKQRSEQLQTSLGEFLSENGIQLFIEPGRSLLDQAGVILARVQNVRQSARGENMVVMDMNRSHINAQDLEYMADPVIIPAGSPRDEPFSAFLVGSLCLPHDFLTRRKVFFHHPPQAGDILAFVNTAGYFMDFSESSTLQHPVATKLAVRVAPEGVQVYADELYPRLCVEAAG